MTIFNVKLAADEAVAMTDTLAVRRGRSPVRLSKVQELPGAILTGAGANSVFENFERLVIEGGYSGFDAIAPDAAEIAHEALAERLEELRAEKPNSPGVYEMMRGIRHLLSQGDPEGIAGGANYQIVMAGPSERFGRMAAVMTDFQSGDVQHLEVPSFSGNDPDVIPPVAAQGIPTMQRQAEVLRAQYQSSVRWARESGFQGCEADQVGGGDVEATRIDMAGVIHRENLGPLLEQARSQKVGRNDPCPCGSGAKYKKCCLRAAA